MLDNNKNADTAPSSLTASVKLQHRWIWVFTWSIPAVYALFYLLTWNRVGNNDFDQFLVFHQFQYWNSTLFGMAKQWTPLMCAGLSMAGEPQIPFMSLSMILSYAFGPLLGLKLASVTYVSIGWIGAYLYAGLWRSDKLTRALAASLFIGNGFFVFRTAVGHIDFIPFYVLPMALWGLHKTLEWRHQGSVAVSALRASTMVVIYAIGIAIAIDGSPVAIIHLLFWVCLYALVLAYHERSFVPCVVLCCAVIVAAVLDAGYLWPMLDAQGEFPRHTADIFTDPLGLLLHALIPLRGKITHGSGKGHELTVFIGPILALLIWRYRAALASSLPRSMLKPLIVVSVISIWFGMGSLRYLHIPQWLSPFDMLRPLPGFRSIGVTARYWGFLAVPLSLLGAVALQRFLSEAPLKKATVWVSLALVLQVGSQAEVLWAKWSDSRIYEATDVQSYFHGRAENISYYQMDARRVQGEFLTPTRAVTNCYNMDDFLHAPSTIGDNSIIAEANYSMGAGTRATLTKISLPAAPNEAATRLIANTDPQAVVTDAKLLSWNHWQVRDADAVAVGTRIVVLNQAWNRHWSAQGCDVLRSDNNLLALRCDNAILRRGVDLRFNDEVSNAGAATSLRAWPIILMLLTGCLLVLALRRERVAVLQGQRAAD